MGHRIGRLYEQTAAGWIKLPYWIVEYDLAEHPELAGEVDPGEDHIQLAEHISTCHRAISKPMARRIKRIMEARNA